MISINFAKLLINDKNNFEIAPIFKKYFSSPELLAENFTIVIFYYSKKHLLINLRCSNGKYYLFKRDKENLEPYTLRPECSKIAKEIINEKEKSEELFQGYNGVRGINEYIYIERGLEVTISDFYTSHYFINLLNGRSTLAIELSIFNNFYNYMLHQNLLIKLSTTFMKNKDIEKDITTLTSDKKEYEDALNFCNKELERKGKQKEIYDSNILLLKSNEEIDAQFDEYNLKKQLRGL